mmetsp:Transcript_15544/g.44868  ORF Transcript_15544/g.44868 Transcript_15544/m.44868 type:complete len:146 (+) Transcript_15544:193-630(+)
MNNTLRVQITHSTQHLFHQASTFSLCVVIIRLLIQTVKEFTSDTKFLHKINLRMTFVYFFQTNNIRVVELTHDKNLFTKPGKALFGINKAQIQHLHSVFDTSCFVGDKTHQTRNSRTQNRPSVNSIIDFFDRLSKGNFHVHNIRL